MLGRRKDGILGRNVLIRPKGHLFDFASPIADFHEGAPVRESSQLRGGWFRRGGGASQDAFGPVNENACDRAPTCLEANY